MVLETNVLVVNRLQQTDNDVDSLRSFDAAETEIAIPTVTVQDHVREMLVDLRDATSAPAAEAAMKVLEKFIDIIDSDKEREKARLILDLNGVSTIVVALWKWQTSQDFCVFALATLCDLVYLEEETKKVIAEIGGVDTILMAINKHTLTASSTNTFASIINKENSRTKVSKKSKELSKSRLANELPLKSNAVGLLGSLSFSDVSRHVVASEECMDFVLETMKLYPNHSHMQKWGCIFVFQVSKDMEVKNLLVQRNVITRLASIIDTFRGRDGGEVVIEKAKPALRVFVE